MMEWNPLAVPALLATTLGMSMSALVFRARPFHAQNRRLSLLLVLEAVIILTMHGGNYLLESREAVRWAFGLGTVAVGVKPSAYLYFLASLETPLTRPLRTRTARLVLLAAAVVAAVLWFAVPDVFLGAIVPVDYAAWQPMPGSLLRPLAVLLSLVYLCALVFAISAYRHSRTDIERRRNRVYAKAFVTRDALFIVWALLFLIVPPAAPHWHHLFIAIAFMPLIYIPLVTYAILREQVFGIDLHLTFALRHGTVAAAFAVTFFAASEGLEQLVPFHGAWLGLAAAGAISLALRPIQRLADRVVTRFFPGVRDTPQYRARRKEEVYRGALEGILADGEITTLERTVLARLAHNFDIADGLARRLEQEARRALRPATATGGLVLALLDGTGDASRTSGVETKLPLADFG